MIIEPLAGALGAEIRGVSLPGPDEDAWREIRRAFLEYAVLVFRDQALEAADLMRVGARFGEPCFYPFVTGMDGYPHIFEVVKAENEGTNFGGNWHSDTTYLEQPPLATLLYAVETPSRGGDTLFTSTRAAYDALSEGMRRLVDGLVGVNSAGLKHGGGRSAMHRKIGGMKGRDTASAAACGGSPSERRHRGRTSAPSIQLRPALLDDLRPLREIGEHELTELPGRAADRLRSVRHDPLAYLGLVENLHEVRERIVAD